MKSMQNLHTHTTFCDGRDTPEEMVLAAIDKGFCSIGFSGHSHMAFSPRYGMTPEGTHAYVAEVRRLQKKYADRIDVFCGIEYELYSECGQEGYDYLIGSAHYFKIGDDYIGFDRSPACVKEVVDTHFGGDGMKYARAYYELLATLPSRGRFDIVGHFDLVAKHCETLELFDIDSSEYLAQADIAIDALAGKIPFFEVNTGGMARGYRSFPYPSLSLVRRLLARGFLPVISSDCHDKNNLDHAFDAAAELLLAAGAGEHYILTKQGFQARPLDRWY